MKISKCCSSLRCWGGKAKTNKTNKEIRKKGSSIEGEMETSSNLSQSSGISRDSNSGGGRNSWRHSILSLMCCGSKAERSKSNQKVEKEKNEGGNVMSYSYSGRPRPMIIQDGGVASCHPIYSPSGHSSWRSSFYSPSATRPGSCMHRHRPADVQRSETKSKAEKEEEAEEESKEEEEEECEVIEECVNESHSPQSAQNPPSLEDEDATSEMPTGDGDGDAEQSPVTTESNPNPNSLVTAIRERCRAVGSKIICIGKMTIPLFILLVVATAIAPLLLDNDKVNYMGQIKNLSDCSSSSSFSYLKSMIGKNWAKFVNHVHPLSDIAWKLVAAVATVGAISLLFFAAAIYYFICLYISEINS